MEEGLQMTMQCKEETDANTGNIFDFVCVNFAVHVNITGAEYQSLPFSPEKYPAYITVYY